MIKLHKYRIGNGWKFILFSLFIDFYSRKLFTKIRWLFYKKCIHWPETSYTKVNLFLVLKVYNMRLVERMCTLLPPPPRLGLRKQPKYDLPDLLDCTISIRVMRIALVLAKPDFGLLLRTCFSPRKKAKSCDPYPMMRHTTSVNVCES